MRSGYSYRIGSGNTSYLIDFRESGNLTYVVHPYHPWHLDYGTWVFNCPQEIMRYQIEIDEESNSNLEDWGIYVELQTEQQAMHED